MSTTQKPIEILLIEDNEGDVFLTKKAFHDSQMDVNISVARDGEIAMEMLNKLNGYQEMPSPDLVLLDMNLPKKDGKQILFEIKQSKTLKRIPVIVLTSSHAEGDILKSYELYASSYIVKPASLERFSAVVTTIEDFWFNVVTLPSVNERKKL